MAAASIDAGSVTGVVLAGGRGTRMGGADKGWVDLEGRPLIEHVLERLRPQVGAIIISANRNIARYRALGWPVVQDEPFAGDAFLGPLAGMLAALRAARSPWLAIVPCDAPALPAMLVRQLARAVGPSANPALAVCGGRRQPVFCLLPAGIAPALAAALARGDRRPDDFLRAAGAIEVPFGDEAAFANINAPSRAPGAPPPDAGR